MAKTAYPGKGRAAFWDNQLGGGKSLVVRCADYSLPPADCKACCTSTMFRVQLLQTCPPPAHGSRLALYGVGTTADYFHSTTEGLAATGEVCSVLHECGMCNG